MSSLQVHHPEDGLLLRYIDGELPARKVRQVARHLEACWQCRSEMEELESTVADCVRYRRNVLQAHLPPPPNPWPDIYREFARVDASMSQEPWVARLQRSFLGPRVLRWGLAFAALLVLAVGVFQQLREVPAVQAATLLRKAVSAADAHSMRPHRILVQTPTARMVKLVGSRPVGRSGVLPGGLQARLDGAHYDGGDPLSAKAYLGWYDHLTERHDEVTTVADPVLPAEKCFQIRTVTEDGTVAAASLVLRKSDLRPVESKLEFRDQEWVEFTEIADAAAGDIGLPAAPGAEGTTRVREGGQPGGSMAEPAASVADELQVLSALHDIGADLGDPLEVTRSGGRVLVSGVGIQAARQKQIREALDGIAHVQIEFSEPSAAEIPTEPGGPGTSNGSARNAGIAARVEQQVGGRVEFERFSSQVLDRNELMMARAYALRALAQRFPADQESGLSPAEQKTLGDMARDDTTALLREASGMERALVPILTAMGGTAGGGQAGSQSAWEPAAEELFQSSRRVEVLVSVLLGAARSDGSTDLLPSELLSAMRDLRAKADRCRQLLGQ